MTKQQLTVNSQRHLGVLVLPDTSWLQLGILGELMQAPCMVEQSWLQVTYMHVDDEQQGVRLPNSIALQSNHSFQTLLVLSNTAGVCELPTSVTAWLTQQFRNASELLLVGNVVELLAPKGLFDDKRVACHWSQIERLQETFSHVKWSRQLFCQEASLLTCAGGMATMDMLLHWLQSHDQADLAAAVTEWLLMERGRDENTQQRLPLQSRIGNSQPKLTEVVSLMEANLDEPLSADELATFVGLSRRHLERLFKKHLAVLPSRFYMQMRLDKARHLLRDTDLSIVEVSMAAGFSSASHFSTTYRGHFGITPRQERGRSMSVETASGLPSVVSIQARLD